MKILFIFGTRPEAIKMAPVLAEAEQRGLSPIVCTTAQHRQMLDQVLDLFGIKPDFDLDLMTPGQTLPALTARLIQELDRVVAEVKPDWVLVQGDTTSAMAGALVAFYHRVKIGHIEAGLRTYDNFQPFPEEVNRRMIDIVADAYFAPTEMTAENLLREGIPTDRIFVTGNTVVDALLDVSARPFDWAKSRLQAINPDRPMVLITAHRRESFGAPFRQICLAIRDLATAYPNLQFVYPVHLNPNVQEPVKELLSDMENVVLLPPAEYVEFCQLMKSACLILTDSGGVQEEGPTFGVPVLVMRETTERPEGIEAGVSRLVGTDRERIVREASAILQRVVDERPLELAPNPYGDGRASSRILDAMIEFEAERGKTATPLLSANVG
jgi:UDP-N-acetylglucosamine 2-epimerase (non-hydrolysing)